MRSPPTVLEFVACPSRARPSQLEPFPSPSKSRRPGSISLAQTSNFVSSLAIAIPRKFFPPTRTLRPPRYLAPPHSNVFLPTRIMFVPLDISHSPLELSPPGSNFFLSLEISLPLYCARVFFGSKYNILFYCAAQFTTPNSSSSPRGLAPPNRTLFPQFDFCLFPNSDFP